MDYKYHKKYHKRVKSLYVEKCIARDTNNVNVQIF